MLIWNLLKITLKKILFFFLLLINNIFLSKQMYLLKFSVRNKILENYSSCKTFIISKDLIKIQKANEKQRRFQNKNIYKQQDFEILASHGFVKKKAKIFTFITFLNYPFCFLIYFRELYVHRDTQIHNKYIKSV